MNHLKEIDIIEYIVNLTLLEPVRIIKTIFLVLNLILITAIVLLILKTSWFQENYGIELAEFLPSRRRKKEDKKWKKLLKQAQSKNLDERKLAILEAESILDEILNRKKVKGETLLEKVSNLAKENKITLEDFESFKKAWQTVSQIIKNPEYSVGPKEAQKTISTIKTIQEKI